jgi:hypothetical protein
MQESKDIRWRDGSAMDELPADGEAVTPSGDPTTDDGWQQYRRWISKAPAPRTRRSSIDPSLYTWKGYRSWAKQVKRNWSDT